jgi:hypothetical protein
MYELSFSMISCAQASVTPVRVSPALIKINADKVRVRTKDEAYPIPRAFTVGIQHSAKI